MLRKEHMCGHIHKLCSGMMRRAVGASACPGGWREKKPTHIRRVGAVREKKVKEGYRGNPRGLAGMHLPSPKSTAFSSKTTLFQLSGQALNSFGRKYTSQALTNLSMLLIHKKDFAFLEPDSLKPTNACLSERVS